MAATRARESPDRLSPSVGASLAPTRSPMRGEGALVSLVPSSNHRSALLRRTPRSSPPKRPQCRHSTGIQHGSPKELKVAQVAVLGRPPRNGAPGNWRLLTRGRGADVSQTTARDAPPYVPRESGKECSRSTERPWPKETAVDCPSFLTLVRLFGAKTASIFCGVSHQRVGWALDRFLRNYTFGSWGKIMENPGHVFCAFRFAAARFSSFDSSPSRLFGHFASFFLTTAISATSISMRILAPPPPPLFPAQLCAQHVIFCVVTRLDSFL